MRDQQEHQCPSIREYFPKGTDFAAVDPGKAAAAYEAINRRLC